MGQHRRTEANAPKITDERDAAEAYRRARAELETKEHALQGAKQARDEAQKTLDDAKRVVDDMLKLPPKGA